MLKLRMNETDELKLSEQDIFVQLYSALGAQGYSLVIDDVDGNYPRQGHDFTVSIYEQDSKKTIAHRIALEEARHYAESDETGLNFVSDYRAVSTVPPAAAQIIFKEMQQNGQMAYIWFDYEEEQFPVILRVGNRETAFSSWTAAINHYRDRFGYRSAGDWEREEQMQDARQRYKLCRTVYQNQRRKRSADN